MKLFISVSILMLLFTAQAFANAQQDASDESPSVQVTGVLDRVEGYLVQKNDAYWDAGDYPRIIGLDRIITAGDPHETECYDTGGWLMDSLGHPAEAEAYYRQGCQNNPHTEMVYFHFAFFYFNRKHYAKAVTEFKLASEQKDADINDWKMLAHAYEHAHEYDQAVATWQHIKKVWPRGIAVDVNMQRAIAMQKTAQHKARAR